MLFQFNANYFEFVRDSGFVGFAQETSNKDPDGHYFWIMGAEIAEDIGPDLQHIYIELDDQCGGQYGGLTSIALSRDRFTVYLDHIRDQEGIDTEFNAIQIDFKCDDTEFQDLCEILQRIMECHEDKLTFTEVSYST